MDDADVGLDRSATEQLPGLKATLTRPTEAIRAELEAVLDSDQLVIRQAELLALQMT